MIIDNKKLNDLLKEKGIVKSELCKALNISSRTLAKINREEEVRDSVIQKLSSYFNVPKEKLFKTNTICETLKREMENKISGGLYYETVIRLTYNSNHMEGNILTEEQTRYIFETQTLGEISSNVKIDDVIETNNHFKCVDYVIANAFVELDEKFIKKLHFLLKQGTKQAEIYGAGEFKKYPNVIGGEKTTNPQLVEKDLKTILKEYNHIKNVKIEDIVEFHFKFEKIHPFQDGNGRVGRLIMFKECLKHNIMPFYIDDRFKAQYYNGLKVWKEERGFLLETCLFGQDLYKQILDYFKIDY